MAQIDFDLARYIAHRKGRVLQRARDGAAYGFSRELRHRRNLIALRPVSFAIDATSRQWKGSAKNELLEASARSSSACHPRLFQAAEAAANALTLEHRPPMYVSDTNAPVGSWALGTDDDSLIVIHPLWLDALSDSELQAVIGRTLGYVQNNLVPYSTALYYLEHDAFFFVRWIVTPAIMALRAWAKRADITCDRAGLIATRSVGISVASMLRSEGAFAGPLDYDGLLDPRSLPTGPVSELVADNKHLKHRIAALHVFSKTYLYSQLIGDQSPDGMATDKADELVSEILEG
ncbi:MAG: hypothetical protein GY811_11045 [Myxococcales bacterium]|nr:hypothetical protein [Myxococcales bacterium]